MREVRRSKSLPGIALNGFATEQDVNEARAAGFSEHLTQTDQLRAAGKGNSKPARFGAEWGKLASATAIIWFGLAIRSDFGQRFERT
jgi:hypothetical protein